MATPTTSYKSGFPDVEYPGNTQQERSLQENALAQRARDYNTHDEEIKALQSYVGPHPTKGWAAGDKTVNDRIIDIGGTGACWEGGTICIYDTIDPSGFIAQRTGQLINWINPTGLDPSLVPIPPIPIGGPPWPGPGGGPVGDPNGPGPGGGGPGGPRGPNDPYVPPDAPWSPVGPGAGNFGPWTKPKDDDGDGLLDWNTTDFLQYLLWRVDTNTTRLEYQSGESIAWWPRRYEDLPDPVARIIELLNGWPTGRTAPGSLTVPRASLHDVLLPIAATLNFILGITGISVAVGTVSGSEVRFTPPANINGGTAGTTVTEAVAVLSNSYHASWATTNITDLKLSGGASILGTGINGPGVYAVVFSGALNNVHGTQVLVFYRNRLLHL